MPLYLSHISELRGQAIVLSILPVFHLLISLGTVIPPTMASCLRVSHSDASELCPGWVRWKSAAIAGRSTIDGHCAHRIFSHV